MTAQKLNVAHLRRIQAILDACDDGDLAHAALACEDALVAIKLGLMLGLTLEQVAAQHRTIRRENGDGS